MKTDRFRDIDFWLLVLLVLLVIVVYRIWFHIPAAGFDEEVVRSLQVE